MAEPVPIALARGSDAGRYPQLGIARLLNCYVEELGEMGKSPFSVVAINGLAPWGVLPDADGGVRGMLALDNELLVVAGRQLYRLSAAGGTAQLVGGIPADGIVTMAANRASPRNVAIVAGGAYYLYDEGGTVTEGNDADLPSPVAVTSISGYLAFIIEDGRFFIAGPDDTNVGLLDFASAEASADRNVMVGKRGRELVIFGAGSTEFWSETGTGDFPFGRVQVIDVGCYAPASVANVLVLRSAVAATDTLMWVASDSGGAYAGVVLLDGYAALPVSTPEIDALIRAEANPDDIRGYSWTEDGHSFYALTGTGWTKVYDTKAGRWHDRETASLGRWRPSAHASFARLHLFGDADSGTVYVSTPETAEDAGERIRYEIVLPTIHMFPKRFKVNALHVDAVTGVGLNTSDSDADPVLMIEVSRDAGASWGPARMASLGRMAQRQVRIKERTFGNFDHNGMTLRLSCTAKVARAIQGAAIEAEPLTT